MQLPMCFKKIEGPLNNGKKLLDKKAINFTCFSLLLSDLPLYFFRRQHISYLHRKTLGYCKNKLNFTNVMWINLFNYNYIQFHKSLRIQIRNEDELTSPNRRTDLGQLCSISKYKSCRNSELFQDFCTLKSGKDGLKLWCIVGEVISSSFLNNENEKFIKKYNHNTPVMQMGLTNFPLNWRYLITVPIPRK